MHYSKMSHNDHCVFTLELEEKIENALGLDEPRTTEDLLRTLSDAVDTILLGHHNYDGQGHENLRYAVNDATNRAKILHEIHLNLKRT